MCGQLELRDSINPEVKKHANYSINVNRKNRSMCKRHTMKETDQGEFAT